MATSLGKVGIVDKGNYSSEETYNSGDFIFYEGSTWLALKDGLIGIEPVEGENWKYLARGVPDGIATVEQVGVVKPSEDLTIEPDGTLGINTVFETIAERANIESGDAWETVLGKINKYFGDIKPHAFLDKITEEYIDSVITQKVNNAIQSTAIVNNAVTTIEGTVLDGRMGKSLQDQITEQNKNIVGILNGKTVASNVDEIVTGGCYDVNPDTQGTLPSPNGYALLFVRTANTTWVYQDLIYTDTVNYKHYQRMKINNEPWTQWDKYVKNSDLNWKTLGYYEQGVEVSLPSSFTELLVVIYINGWAFTLPITYITLTDSERGYLGGSTWNTSSNYYGYHVNCSKTKIILRNANFGGTTPEAKAMAVYYR